MPKINSYDGGQPDTASGTMRKSDLLQTIGVEANSQPFGGRCSVLDPPGRMRLIDSGVAQKDFIVTGG
jgi:hypothetical protein